MNKRIFILAVFFLGVFIQISCKTKQLVFHDLYTPNTEELVKLMKKNQFQFNTLSLKFNVEAQSGEENNGFSGNIYIVKDSLMWLSIQKMGMEAFRLLITPDSVKMLDRINKVYFPGDFHIINNMLKTSFDFEFLQTAITGNDVESYDTAGYTVVVEDTCYVLNFEKRYRNNGGTNADYFIQKIYLSKINGKIIKNAITAPRPQQLMTLLLSYSGFQDFNGKKFPSVITFSAKSESRTTTGYITFTRISPEKKESAPFTIPDGYKRGN